MSIFIGILFCTCPVAAKIAVERLDIRQPRSFGYQIGDKFERTLSLQLRKPYRLTPDELPTPGRLGEWLVLEAPEIVHEDLGASTRYEIRLTYQIINVKPDLPGIAVPHHFLPYTDGQETLKVLVPAWRVGVSVLRMDGHDELQPDRQPWSLPFDYFKTILCGSLLLISLLGLACLHWGLPSSAQRRPFMDANRRLRRARHRHWDEHQYHEVLQIIHQAFNEVAGKTVFADALAEFFDDHKQFALLREPITDFFLRSRKVFFDGGAKDPGARYSQGELVAFVRRCSDLERGLV